MRTPLSTLDKIMADDDKARVGSVFLAALRPLAATFLACLAAFLTSSTGGVLLMRKARLVRHCSLMTSIAAGAARSASDKVSASTSTRATNF